ncbi:MAG TPA: helix-turn-helix domain-containing protein, partial [Stellaceae bacterium]|nr:helix-turn-helix domain-containing protein [Stellaceae bacterium]
VDFEGAVEIFHAMGMTDVTERMVRRYADDGVLPFFAGIGKKRRISEHELRMAVKGMQLDALKGHRSRREAAPRHR